MTTIGIVGAAGRMGRLIAAAIQRTPTATLGGALEYEGNAALGSDMGALAGIGNLGIAVGTDREALFAVCDVVIDFSLPESTRLSLDAAVRHGTALLIGTTGLSAEDHALIDAAGEKIAGLQAANTSLGVNVLVELVRQAAATLDADFDIEIVEAHHRHKVDAPSGTALALGQAAAEGRGINLETNSVRSRDGHTGPRPEGSIGFATVRGGDVAGEHDVLFLGEGERITLGHVATNRAIFANGAVKGAMWLAGQKPGRYTMKQVLGLG